MTINGRLVLMRMLSKWLGGINFQNLITMNLSDGLRSNLSTNGCNCCNARFLISNKSPLVSLLEVSDLGVSEALDTLFRGCSLSLIISITQYGLITGCFVHPINSLFLFIVQS